MLTAAEVKAQRDRFKVVPKGQLKIGMYLVGEKYSATERQVVWGHTVYYVGECKGNPCRFTLTNVSRSLQDIASAAWTDQGGPMYWLVYEPILGDPAYGECAP